MRERKHGNPERLPPKTPLWNQARPETMHEDVENEHVRLAVFMVATIPHITRNPCDVQRGAGFKLEQTMQNALLE